jgi:hypothetical protein
VRVRKRPDIGHTLHTGPIWLAVRRLRDEALGALRALRLPTGQGCAPRSAAPSAPNLTLADPCARWAPEGLGGVVPFGTSRVQAPRD